SLRSSKTLWNWLTAVQQGQWAEQRRDGAIVIYRQDATEGARFVFERAGPASYKCSDVSASGGELAGEELELACEVFERVDPGDTT
ncbi:MAG: phage tail protein, partial [Leptolyngbyaceae cyanobacterium]